MNSKIIMSFSTMAIAAVALLFASGLMLANHHALAVLYYMHHYGHYYGHYGHYHYGPYHYHYHGPYHYHYHGPYHYHYHGHY